MAVAGYLEKYFECVESLPLELQRYVTQLREVEIEAQGVLHDMRSLRTQLALAVRDGDASKQRVVFRQLQQCMIKTRDFGNSKVEISSNLLETVEDYNQQLMLKGKAIDISASEEYYHPQRNTAVNGNSHSSSKDSTSSTNGNGYSETKSTSKRPSGTKRVRPPVVDRDEDSNGGHTRESSTTPSTGNSQHTNNGKPAKKKVKTVKKKNAVTPKVVMATEKDTPSPLPHVPMPDLTSQPLDPDEPTYCLCQQVSFGEMIGCDNDDCPIEWFHFQCVNLTSKPKGKWFCPQCSQARKSKMSKSLA